VIGSAEGISFLLLLFVAMPIKYLGHNPTLVHWLGPVHGGLFLLYLASVVGVARILNWRWLHIMLAFISSVVPFGPFVFEAWLRRLRPPLPLV
jgi:integral membrane protein